MNIAEMLSIAGEVLMFIVLVLAMTLSGSLGSFYLKRASGQPDLRGLLTSSSLYAGGVLYFIGCVLNILLLRIADYSVALPMTALTYVWTMFISHLRLGESLTGRKLLGVAFIVLGAVFVAL